MILQSLLLKLVDDIEYFILIEPIHIREPNDGVLDELESFAAQEEGVLTLPERVVGLSIQDQAKQYGDGKQFRADTSF